MKGVLEEATLTFPEKKKSGCKRVVKMEFIQSTLVTYLPKCNFCKEPILVVNGKINLMMENKKENITTEEIWKLDEGYQ